MKKLLVALALTALVVSVAVTTASAKRTANADVCVLLPDSKSSVRWETADRPYLAAAFKKAGVSYNIVNAEGSATTQRSQADQCLTNGAKVILLVNLDSGSGAAIEKAAAAKGAKTIDYDRLTLNGAAAYYVSFDNVQVGKLMGKGIVKALTASGKINSKPVIAYLNGGPTDNNATLFKQGYAGVIDPLFKSGKAVKGPDQSVPGWDNQKARTIFDQMLVKTSNKIDAVAAANDGLGNAVVTALAGQEARADPGLGPGRDGAGRAEHPRRHPGGDGLQADQAGGRRGLGARDLADQGHRREDERQGERRHARRAVGAADADVDHEGELQDPLHGQVPEEGRRLQRHVREVLQVDPRGGWGRRLAPPPSV